jgi:hypothetical protein
MPENISNDNDLQRARLIEDVRRLLFEGMKKAEEGKNWEVFNRYAHAYIKMIG